MIEATCPLVVLAVAPTRPVAMYNGDDCLLLIAFTVAESTGGVLTNRRSDASQQRPAALFVPGPRPGGPAERSAQVSTARPAARRS